MLQSRKPIVNNSPLAELAQLSSHDPDWLSGQIHVKLFQACSLVWSHVVVQFEQNEFVSGEVSWSYGWEHEVSFDVTCETSLIICNVYDRVDLLGYVQIKPLLIHNHTDDQWYKLRSLENEVVSGELRVQVTFEQPKVHKTDLSPPDFQFLRLIGHGTLGEVIQVRKKDTRRIYAMKVLSKEVIAKTEITHTFGEEHKILHRLQSPFLVGLKFSFQTDIYIYLVTDFRSGGELSWHLQQETLFNEGRARFYIAELILALEYLHKHDIIYRNLKPENVLLDATGHVALCHFGLSTADIRFKERTNTFSGTTEYLAPEILLNEVGYSKSVDFWSLGVLLYRMCCGWSPFYADDTQQMYKNICFGKIHFPEGVINEDGKQFVNSLLNRNPKHRLGAMRDTEELKEHPFVSSINWAAEPKITGIVLNSDKEDSSEDSFAPATFIQKQGILLSSSNSAPPQPKGIDIKPRKRNFEAVGIPLPRAPAEMFPLHRPKAQFTDAPTFTPSAAGLSNKIGYHLRAVQNVDDPFETSRKFEHHPEPSFRTPADLIMDPSKPDLDTWFEPIPVAGFHDHFASSSEDPVTEDSFSESSTETPSEPEDTVLHEEVDHNTLEMTCGPLVEELFWPLRSRIRTGKFHAYENSLQVLVVRSRKQLQPVILSKLTNELALRRVGSTLSLTSFLDESRSRRERLWQFASEVGAINLQDFRDAIWKDSVIIMLVFYETFTSKTDVDDIMQLRGDKAQFILDLMQDAIRTHIDFVHILRGGTPRLHGSQKIFLNEILERGLLRNVDRPSTALDARRLLIRLSEAAEILPSSLAILGVNNKSTDPLFGGAFGDVYDAKYEGNRVALKRLRLFHADGEDGEESRQIRRKFCREALIWKNLDHEYVLPFLGVDSDSFPGFLCMVSPWMSRGAIVTARGGPNISSIPILMYEIAVGLQYLHSENIVHGDLRGANILLDDEGHARLADFGLTTFADGPLAPTKRGGSTRWMAPELLDPESCGLEVFQRTFASDIYSFACVCLEVYTGTPPFSNIASEGAVLLKVIKGGRPECPTTMPDWCSQYVTKCWSHTPVNRPGIGSIIASIVTGEHVLVLHLES
ncbi:kinase-like domain-containing protein [Mycena alexandri]|uniref:Kinase-like domain-containing protein n=1 Tax=Mycena alexandri TaxID=1745969 RepID=A0AAD6TDV7_9AGAR|nr:kinase-like domain-containing protein [Mycena alexandri]